MPGARKGVANIIRCIARSSYDSNVSEIFSSKKPGRVRNVLEHNIFQQLYPSYLSKYYVDVLLIYLNFKVDVTILHFFHH